MTEFSLTGGLSTSQQSAAVGPVKTQSSYIQSQQTTWNVDEIEVFSLMLYK
jgi:hypothetical protein